MNYNKTDVEYIREAYKRGLSLDSIVRKLTEEKRYTPTGQKYTTGTISYIANNLGLRRITRKKYTKARTNIAPTINKHPDAHQIMCDVLTSNLAKDSQVYLVKLLSERL